LNAPIMSAVNDLPDDGQIPHARQDDPVEPALTAACFSRCTRPMGVRVPTI
jgi:hypothetical protein